jgi:hypothetical protein
MARTSASNVVAAAEAPGGGEDVGDVIAAARGRPGDRPARPARAGPRVVGRSVPSLRSGSVVWASCRRPISPTMVLIEQGGVRPSGRWAPMDAADRNSACGLTLKAASLLHAARLTRLCCSPAWPLCRRPVDQAAEPIGGNRDGKADDCRHAGLAGRARGDSRSCLSASNRLRRALARSCPTLAAVRRYDPGFQACRPLVPQPSSLVVILALMAMHWSAVRDAAACASGIRMQDRSPFRAMIASGRSACRPNRGRHRLAIRVQCAGRQLPAEHESWRCGSAPSDADSYR